MYLGDREAFEETLRRLSYERIIPQGSRASALVTGKGSCVIRAAR
jgi:hypothetical protein